MRTTTTPAVLCALAVLAACGGDPEETTTARDPAATRPLALEAETGVPGEGVTVVGRATRSVPPDVLEARIGVEVESPDLQEAFDEAGAAAEQVIDALREQGVAADDISTQSFTVRDRREEPPPRRESRRGTVDGFVVRNLLDVTIRDLEQAGEVLAGAVDAGGEAIRVEGVRFALEDDEGALRREAREEAFEDAREQAEQYAELAGRELGPLVSITEVSGGAAPLRAGRLEAAPPVEPGTLTVDVAVRATWKLD